MAAIPIDMIKGTKRASSELDETDSAIQHTNRKRNTIRRKVKNLFEEFVLWISYVFF